MTGGLRLVSPGPDPDGRSMVDSPVWSLTGSDQDRMSSPAAVRSAIGLRTIAAYSRPGDVVLTLPSTDPAIVREAAATGRVGLAYNTDARLHARLCQSLADPVRAGGIDLRCSVGRSDIPRQGILPPVDLLITRLPAARPIGYSGYDSTGTWTAELAAFTNDLVAMTGLLVAGGRIVVTITPRRIAGALIDAAGAVDALARRVDLVPIARHTAVHEPCTGRRSGGRTRTGHPVAVLTHRDIVVFTPASADCRAVAGAGGCS